MAIVLSAYKLPESETSGLEKFWIVDKDARIDSGVTVSISAGSATIAGTGATAFEIKPQANSTNYDETNTSDRNNLSTMVKQLFTSMLHGSPTAAMIQFADSLRRGRFEVYMMDREGNYFVAGLDFPGLQDEGGSGIKLGAGPNDPKGISINLGCESKDTAPEFVFSEFEAAFTLESA